QWPPEAQDQVVSVEEPLGGTGQRRVVGRLHREVALCVLERACDPGCLGEARPRARGAPERALAFGERACARLEGLELRRTIWRSGARSLCHTYSGGKLARSGGAILSPDS